MEPEQQGYEVWTALPYHISSQASATLSYLAAPLAIFLV